MYSPIAIVNAVIAALEAERKPDGKLPQLRTTGTIDEKPDEDALKKAAVNMPAVLVHYVDCMPEGEHGGCYHTLLIFCVATSLRGGQSASTDAEDGALKLMHDVNRTLMNTLVLEAPAGRMEWAGQSTYSTKENKSVYVVRYMMDDFTTWPGESLN